jgi:hypothetical protein
LLLKKADVLSQVLAHNLDNVTNQNLIISFYL